jgi:subtilase family serine protease
MPKLPVALLALLLGTLATAAVPPVVVRGARSEPAIDHDTSPALRDVPPVPPRHSGPPRQMRKHGGPRLAGGGGPSGPHLLPDPVVQSAPGTAGMPPTEQSFDGLGNVDLVLPPDPNGDVGPNHYVQWVNTSFAIYDKAGTLLYGPAAGNTLWAGFGGPCQSTNDGDPIVLYDSLADRWVMSQLALPSFPFGPFYQCVAVSQAGDPLGPYHRYAFRISDTKLNDYPKLAVWPDGYYLAVNQFDEVSLGYAGQGVAVFEREKMLAGLPATMVYVDLFGVDPNLGGMLPADLDGVPPPPGAPGYYVQFDDDAWGYAAEDRLQLWRFHVDWTDPSASTFTGPALVPTAAFDSNLCGYSRTCIPQPGTVRRLDAISDRLLWRLQYRNLGSHEALVVNHTVDAGGDHAGVRWYEIRDPAGTPFVHQQGTYAPDADHRWMGSAAMDGSGNLAIGFTVSGSTFPSIRYAGRLADDPPGTLPQQEASLAAGGGPQTDRSGRWGDYSALTVDPTDDCTFWYTHEYYAARSGIGWRTRVGTFRFPSCTSDEVRVTISAIVPTAAEAGGAARLSVRRTGATDEALLVRYTVAGTATPGSDYVALPGTVTIPAGAASVEMDVAAVDDTLVEGEETVIVTIAPDPTYRPGVPSSAVVIVASDDLPPDLVVTALAVPARAGAGDTIGIGDTTQNVGGGAAGASTTRFYLSTDGTLGAGDVPLGERMVPGLVPGQPSAVTTAVVIPPGTASGTRWIIAKADADDALVEGRETNNTRASAITIGADLLVSPLTVPATTGAGQSLAVTDTTKNQGGGTAAPSTTAFYLSTNSVLDAADVLLGSRPADALAPGASSVATTALTIPAATAVGSYWIIAQADAAGTVAETLETNNTTARSIQIGPDLLVSSLTAPATAASGATIAVTDTTKNQGGGAAGATTTAFYLSTNPTVDAADTPLGSRSVPALGAGAVSTATTSLPLPGDLATGTYYVLARADAGAAVVETQEGNNVAARALQIGPDLAVSPFTVPGTAAAGVTITVTDTTRNWGASPAAASVTAFYFSTNATLDAGDALLGTRPVPALASGGTSTVSTMLTIPSATAAGGYFVIARADDTAAVLETQEGNNTNARLVQVGPDLIVPFLTAPAAAAAGATVAVSDTTKNQGGDAAGLSRPPSISPRTTLGATDVRSAPRRPALAPEPRMPARPPSSPAGTAPGSWFPSRSRTRRPPWRAVETNNTGRARCR